MADVELNSIGNGDGNNYLVRDNTKIPLSGSNQISGDLIPATDNAYDLGGSSYGYSNIYTTNVYVRQILAKYSNLNESLSLGVLDTTGCIYLNHKDMDESLAPVKYRGSVNLITSNAGIRMDLFPDGSLTWTGQPIQYGSDARLKQQITEIDDALLDAWEDVELSQFKYNDAVDQKGDKARLHTGYVVQQINEACKEHGVDISQYGLYCHEEYPQEVEEVEVEQTDGTKTKERKVIREASEHYSLRYTEALIVECAYLRKKNKDLQEQLNSLSERLEKLENR